MCNYTDRIENAEKQIDKLNVRINDACRQMETSSDPKSETVTMTACEFIHVMTGVLVEWQNEIRQCKKWLKEEEEKNDQ